MYTNWILKRWHISLHLASLHWLPIDSRIKYKLACICLNCISTNTPPYLSDLLTVYTAARQHRSSSDNSVVHLSVQYPMVKCLSHTLRLLLGTLFLSRSALLIMSLLSDPELKLTFPSCLSIYPLLFVFLSPKSVFPIFSQCFAQVFKRAGCHLKRAH